MLQLSQTRDGIFILTTQNIYWVSNKQIVIIQKKKIGSLNVNFFLLQALIFEILWFQIKTYY